MRDTEESKFWLASAPHSPFAALFRISQSGTKFRFASFQDRVVVPIYVLMGFGAVTMSRPDDMPSRYLLTLTLSAVLPVPNKS